MVCIPHNACGLHRAHTVVIAKIEEPDLPIPQVDTIISEPIGVLLFHERMVRRTGLSMGDGRVLISAIAGELCLCQRPLLEARRSLVSFKGQHLSCTVHRRHSVE